MVRFECSNKEILAGSLPRLNPRKAEWCLTVHTATNPCWPKSWSRTELSEGSELWNSFCFDSWMLWSGRWKFEWNSQTGGAYDFGRHGAALSFASLVRPMWSMCSWRGIQRLRWIYQCCDYRSISWMRFISTIVLNFFHRNIIITTVCFYVLICTSFVILYRWGRQIICIDVYHTVFWFAYMSFGYQRCKSVMADDIPLPMWYGFMF